jgi:hypothetical protein
MDWIDEGRLFFPGGSPSIPTAGRYGGSPASMVVNGMESGGKGREDLEIFCRSWGGHSEWCG